MALDWDLCFSLPLLVTVLAVVLATLLFKLHSGEDKPPAQVPQEEREQEEKDKEILQEPSEEDKIVEEKTTGQKDDSERTNTEKVSVDDIGASEDLPQERGADNETEEEAEACTVKERRLSSHSSQEGEDSKDEDFDLESDKILKISEPDDADDEDFSFKYCPGKLRGSEYEKMLTKEELEEEQRVQRDQLGAIFQMMEKKQETFGAMSEGDVKDQLKLYNM